MVGDTTPFSYYATFKQGKPSTSECNFALLRLYICQGKVIYHTFLAPQYCHIFLHCMYIVAFWLTLDWSQSVILTEIHFQLYWCWNLIFVWKWKHLLSSTLQLRCRSLPVWLSVQNWNAFDCCILRETLILKTVSKEGNIPFMQSDEAKELTSGLSYPYVYYSTLF